MSLTVSQKQKIKKILREKLISKLEEYEEADDMNKPFYFKLFSKENVYMGSLLHSTYTFLGSQWEYFAEIVAENNYESIDRRKSIKGKITDKTRSKIDNILDDLDYERESPNINKEKKEIIESSKDGSSIKTSQQVDLYLKDKNKEYFFEIKTAKPNKNEVKAAKRDLLKIIAMKADVKIFLAIPYNPYFEDEYKRWTVKKFFNSNEDLLVGKHFWNYLGGEGTYEEILNVFEEVGNEIKEKTREFI